MKTEHLASLTRRMIEWKGGYRVSEALIGWHLRTPRPTVEFEVMGFRVRLNPHEYVDRELLFRPQLYEHVELEYVRNQLRPGDTFVDIGANIGVYSLLASKLVGASGRVLAAEADVDTYARLVGNLKLNNAANVDARNYGLSDEKGEFTFYRWTGADGNTGANSFIPVDRPDGGWASAGKVECITLLDLLKLAGVKKLSGLKLDIERAEYKVLKRFFADVPAAMLPRFVLFEEYESDVEQAGGSVVNLLESDGRYRRSSGFKGMARDHVYELK
jgi:FkbM family methyltransferase